MGEPEPLGVEKQLFFFAFSVNGWPENQIQIGNAL